MSGPQNKQTPWIKVGDFREIVYSFAVTNTTTQVPVENSAAIELVEVGDRGITLRLPAYSCSTGHMLMVTLTRKSVQPLDTTAPIKKEGEVSFTAKVAEIEKLDENFNTATLVFFQINETEWKEFITNFNSQQEKVNNLVKTVVE